MVVPSPCPTEMDMPARRPIDLRIAAPLLLFGLVILLGMILDGRYTEYKRKADSWRICQAVTASCTAAERAAMAHNPIAYNPAIP